MRLDRRYIMAFGVVTLSALVFIGYNSNLRSPLEADEEGGAGATCEAENGPPGNPPAESSNNLSGYIVVNVIQVINEDGIMQEHFPSYNSPINVVAEGSITTTHIQKDGTIKQVGPFIHKESFEVDTYNKCLQLPISQQFDYRKKPSDILRVPTTYTITATIRGDCIGQSVYAKLDASNNYFIRPISNLKCSAARQNDE